MSTYFDWGVPPNHEPQVGLWSPVLDRFLLVLYNKDHATTIKYLGSSRYSLYLFDLSASSNYTPGLIDNSCCQNWTISNKNTIKLSCPQDYDILPADLIPSESNDSWNIEQEKEWLQFVWYHLKYLEVLKSNNPWYNYSKFLNSIGITGTELSEANNYYNDITSAEKYTLKSLYLGNNIADTKQAIDMYIDQLHPLIKDPR